MLRPSIRLHRADSRRCATDRRGQVLQWDWTTGSLRLVCRSFSSKHMGLLADFHGSPILSPLRSTFTYVEAECTDKRRRSNCQRKHATDNDLFTARE